MIVLCEECGKKYRIDPANIRGEGAWIRCRTCNHITVIPDSMVARATGSAAVSAPEPMAMPSPASTGPAPTVANAVAAPESHGKSASTVKVRYTGLIAKFMLFLVLPFVIIYGVIIFLTINKMGEMNQITIDQSATAVMDVARLSIKDKARSVARQTRQYLYTHPDLKKEDFNRDVYFKKVAVQKVGENGYTALYEMPEAGGAWRTWAHINPKIVGVNMADFKGAMGSYFNDFWKIVSGVRNGKESEGIYTWKDIDGKMRPKLMFCAPIEGTPYVIAATAYVGEFIAPVKTIEAKVRTLTDDTTRWAIIMMAIGLLINAIIILVYGRALTGRIIHLAEVADRISVGELDAEVDVKSKDEIGELGEAIARMQDSLKISIQRLRRRR